MGLVAATYVYFLIFAQFAFLRRLAALGLAGVHLKAVMAAMAFGGILMSLLAPRLAVCNPPKPRLRVALLGCAAAAFLSLLPLSLPGGLAVSLLIGCGLGLLTVTLVTHLRLWVGAANPLLAVGLGTGLGYFLCNVPPFFAASASTQATVAGGLCVAAVLFTFGAATETPDAPSIAAPQAEMPFARVLLSFTALVWLDSAAFFIIQSTPALKAGTWQGAAHLWSNGALHFAAALLGVRLLARRGLARTLALAFAALAVACLLLNPDRAVLASVFYPVGVSLYSVALVAYPALLSPSASSAERRRRAGWIYAVAGWLGSALGIGMGQHLGHVPALFVAAAGVVVLGPTLAAIFRRRRREVLATAALLLAAFAVNRAMQKAAGPSSSHAASSPVERGRVVYASEGCIHCHSQYVRPNTGDVLLWGPVKSVGELRQHPVVVGNRRQGPDLAEVGSRRSALWLRMHFHHPEQLSHGSFMPSYGYLFANPGNDSRGDDLIAYLESLRGAGVAQHRLAERAWCPSQAAIADANAAAGQRLFAAYCGTCHFASGQTRLSWRTSFRRLPPDVPATAPPRPGAEDATSQRVFRLAQIAKFGLAGTDMPGHEYLSDEVLASIGLWLANHTAWPDDSTAPIQAREQLREQPKEPSGERP